MADEVAGQVREDELDPQRELRRRAALTQVRQYGDPALRLRANEVERFDDELAELAGRMKLLMREAHGVGLAGNQVGVLRRVLVAQLGGPEGEAVALVNPRIVERSDETGIEDEGCLSLQGVLVPVERSSTVRVEATDPAGEPFELALEGMDARVAQHELDHLDGVLILDRTTPEARREALAVLRPRTLLTT